MIEAYVPIRSNAGKGPILGVYRTPIACLSNSTLCCEMGAWSLWLGAATAALPFLALMDRPAGALVIERQQDSPGSHGNLGGGDRPMASAVAHNLRNPMSSIRSTRRIMARSFDPETRFIAAETIAEVDLMDRYAKGPFGYAQSGGHQLAPIDTVRVDAIIETHQRTAERANVTIAGTGAMKRLSSPTRLLEQSLTSIVTNAIEAMPSGRNPGDRRGSETPRAVKLHIRRYVRGIPPIS